VVARATIILQDLLEAVRGMCESARVQMPREDGGPWAWLLFEQSGVVTYAQVLQQVASRGPSGVR